MDEATAVGWITLLAVSAVLLLVVIIAVVLIFTFLHATGSAAKIERSLAELSTAIHGAFHQTTIHNDNRSTEVGSVGQDFTGRDKTQ